MLQPGLVVGPFELISPLGSGGQGSVWLARDRTSGAERALKILDLSRASNTARERAQREADQLVLLHHPAIVECFLLIIEPRLQLLALVLEHVRGRSLADHAADPRLTLARRLDVLQRVAEALAHAHASGVVHRDVKPQNILVADEFFVQPDRPDAVRLVDFGIAVSTGNPDPLTRADRTIGTPAYLAPEQLDPRTWGEYADAPSLDVFAWGVTAWELLVGGHPTGLGEDATQLDFVDAYRRAKQGAGALTLPITPWTKLVAPALALDPRDRLREGATLCRLIAQISSPARSTTEESPESAPALPGRNQAVRGGASHASTTAGVANVGQRLQARPRGTSWVVLLVLLLTLVGTGGLVAIFAAFSLAHQSETPSPASTSPWTAYVRHCCSKSPEFGGGDCSRVGALLGSGDRWWLRYQWAQDAGRSALQKSHPQAEVCAQPAGRDPVCWPAKPEIPATPVEVTTDELTSGSFQIWVRDRGQVLDRLSTRYPGGLSTGVLCVGLRSTKGTMNNVGVVVFSVEPVGENLSKYRGF